MDTGTIGFAMCNDIGIINSHCLHFIQLLNIFIKDLSNSLRYILTLQKYFRYITLQITGM